MMDRREQGTKNLELARQYLHHVMRNPAQLDAIPPRGIVVLMPVDDDELATANAALANSVGDDAVQVMIDGQGTQDATDPHAPTVKTA